MEIKVVLRSHIAKGQILIGGRRETLSLTDYRCEFDLDDHDSDPVASVTGMPAGIKKGVEVVSFRLDGRELFDIPHLSLKDFCVFQMKDNPYVSNETIAERNIVFNGDLRLSLNREKIFWFPFHYSEIPNGFVYSNVQTSCVNDDGCYDGEEKEHLDVWSNSPFDGVCLTDVRKAALGCSVTHGTGISKSLAWPTLMRYTNFGVVGAGVDAVYYNLHNLLSLNPNLEEVIILLPTLERRLARFDSNGMSFRIPILAQDIELANYYWADAEYLSELQKKTQREILEDTDNHYSKEYLDKISRLPVQISVSSWSKETYEILPDHFERVLPFFEWLDDANDNPPHPGPLSHRKWAEKVQKLG